MSLLIFNIQNTIYTLKTSKVGCLFCVKKVSLVVKLQLVKKNIKLNIKQNVKIQSLKMSHFNFTLNKNCDKFKNIVTFLRVAKFQTTFEVFS